MNLKYHINESESEFLVDIKSQELYFYIKKIVFDKMLFRVFKV